MKHMRDRQFITLAAMLFTLTTLAACSTSPAKRRAESMMCGNYMCSFCVAARSCADEEGGFLPSDLLYLTNYTGPRLLVCPGDHARHPATNWASFTPDNSSYEIVTPHLRDGNTNGVFLRCKFHRDHLGYADGTVFDGTSRRLKVPTP
jgi:hypothetical protein